MVHVVRDEHGEVEALVGFMFDISERKATEQKLLALQKELEEYSYTDSLTQVFNRRMLDTVLEQEWVRARREQRPLSLLLIDIDFFKEYNDCYGHLQGDVCLKQVATVLSNAATRARDFFARFGGEEFVMVLPDTGADAASKIAERCQQLIFKQQIPHKQSDISNILTISIGIGTVVPAHQDVLTDFVDRVDRALYQAKLAGRNRIQLA